MNHKLGRVPPERPGIEKAMEKLLKYPALGRSTL